MRRLFSILCLAAIMNTHLFGANLPSKNEEKGLTIGETVEFLEESLVQYVSFWKGSKYPQREFGVLDTSLILNWFFFLMPGIVPCGISSYPICGIYYNATSTEVNPYCVLSGISAAPFAISVCATILSPAIYLMVNGSIYLYNSKTRSICSALDSLDKNDLLQEEQIVLLGPIIFNNESLFRKLNHNQALVLKKIDSNKFSAIAADDKVSRDVDTP